MLFVPGVVAILAGRARWPVVMAAVLATLAGMWWRAAGNGAIDGPWSNVLGLLLGGGLLAGWRRPRLMPVVGAVFGIAGALWWQPCVGRELGDILTRGVDDPVGIGPALAAFGSGVLLPLPAAALAVKSLGHPSQQNAVQLSRGAGLLIGGLAAFGIIDQVGGWLARVSVELAGSWPGFVAYWSL